jgi:hypothetical protein
VDYGHREDAFRHSEIGGFWKKSEDNACRAGRTMVSINEPEFFSHPNWQKARDAHK